MPEKRVGLFAERRVMPISDGGSNVVRNRVQAELGGLHVVGRSEGAQVQASALKGNQRLVFLQLI